MRRFTFQYTLTADPLANTTLYARNSGGLQHSVDGGAHFVAGPKLASDVTGHLLLLHRGQHHPQRRHGQLVPRANRVLQVLAQRLLGGGHAP